MLDRERATIEAASWRLASDLFRRHPHAARLIRGHPGGGQADLLWLLGANESELDVRLNRHGTIQVHGRADGESEGVWPPTPWEDYLAAEPDEFVTRLEAAAGLGAPSPAGSDTTVSVTYDVLAALVATGVHAEEMLAIEQGFIDSSGYGGGRNARLERFAVDAALLDPQPDDLFGEPGYRWWIVTRDREPFVALEQTSATAWFVHRVEPFDVADAHRAAGGDAAVVAAAILGIGPAPA